MKHMATIVLTAAIMLTGTLRAQEHTDTLTRRQQRIVEIAACTGRGDLQTFIAVLGERKAQGISDATGRDASPVTDSRSRYDRGRDILAEISGIPADAPKAAYAEFAPAIERFLKEHLFADLFERDVLTYAERELATVSVIAALGESVEPMLRGHSAICRNLGYTQGQLDRAIAMARAFNAGSTDSNVKNVKHK